MSGIVIAGRRTDANRAEEDAPPPHKQPTFQPSNGWPPSCSVLEIMASLERNISTGPPAGPRRLSAVDERLVGLEDEATRLRAEVAALQDEIHWLTGQDEEPPGWLSRGWVRASLLLTAVGMISLVSLPYLLHRDTPGPHADPASVVSTRPAPRATVTPAPDKPAARDAAPAPSRAHAPEVPEPARILSVDDRPGTAPRPRPVRRALQPSETIAVSPARGESP
jgi:hypothetical protein